MHYIAYFFAKYVFKNKVKVLGIDAAIVRNDVKLA